MKNSNMRKAFTIHELITVILGLGVGLVMLVGWVLNIYKLTQVSAPILEWGAMEILRVVGIFAAPLGSVLGYIG